ncbi:NAD(P)H-binding protein [Nonomuraea sp. NPDC050310]|uniref:NAD(P)H-binding protein n=1 Tax=Nonomuraea sp. NPDC050310 TaxID=3154935 RepID=UPI0033EFB912
MIFVTGATGTIGRALLAELGSEAVAVVRQSGRASASVVADFDRPESFAGLFSPGDRLFLNSSLWPGFVAGHQAVIDLAAEAGVAQIVTVSVRGAAPGQPLGGGLHGLVDQHLRASGVPWAILQPTGFMQNFAADLDGDGVFHGSYGEARMNYIDARDIASCARALLTRPVGASGDHVLTGPESRTHAEFAAVLSAATGRPIRYADLPVPEMGARLAAQGLPYVLAEYMASFADDRWAPLTGTVKDLTGREPRTLAAYAEEFLTPVP